MDSARDVTLVLKRLRQGDSTANSELVELVYNELRKIAAGFLSRERANHTLQPTALVHETYLRLLGKGAWDWEDRAHFFGAAAHVMRNILVDHARSLRAQKRGGGQALVELTEFVQAVSDRVEEILIVDSVLDKLDRWSPRQRTIVEMRFYAGYTEEEIAAMLNLSIKTVKRDWVTARAWLHNEIHGAGGTVLAG
jgi:RNA polymerase sigma-70 factor, ECF subfamily